MIETAGEPPSLEHDLPRFPSLFVLDIGGEGRHRKAWNLNPSLVKTIGFSRGKPIPRVILGRADAIPLPEDCVDLVIVERTPLTLHAYSEIRRVVSRRGTIVLRHAIPPNFDPHRLARELISGRVTQRKRRSGRNFWLQETVFRCHAVQGTGLSHSTGRSQNHVE